MFVSDRRLSPYRKLPAAAADWCLDSGGFTMLRANGRWEGTDREYAARISRYQAEIGRLQWAAPRDWMCEDFILAKTGLTVEEHQRRTTESTLRLRDMVGPVVIPVLQGQTAGDYIEHARAYERVGLSLCDARAVGVGSVCRRQSSKEGAALVLALIDALPGVPLHLFGFKVTGLSHLAAAGALDLVASADSMAWSRYASAPRTTVLLEECEREGRHKNCANCHRWAAQWRADLLHKLEHMNDMSPARP